MEVWRVTQQQNINLRGAIIHMLGDLCAQPRLGDCGRAHMVEAGLVREGLGPLLPAQDTCPALPAEQVLGHL